jgi:hypothetical protein
MAMLTNKRIVIEQNQTRLENAHVLKNGKVSYRKNSDDTTWPTESFLDSLKFSSILLPKNTKYHKSYFGGKRHIFITEYDPTMKNIIIKKNQHLKWEVFQRWCQKKNIKNGEQQFERMNVTEGTKEYIFQILVPYIVTFTMVYPTINDFRFQMFMRNSPLRSFDDMLYKVPFYNIQQNQNVCMGATFNRQELFMEDVSEIINTLHSSFWMSQFNTDYNYNIIAYRYRQIFNNYFIWEYESKYHPEKIFKTEYVAYQQLGKYLQEKDDMYKDSRNSNFKNLVSFFK